MIQTILKIEGMSCTMCEAHINETIYNHFKVKKVSSSFKKGETVVISESSLDENLLKDEIAKTGYQLISIKEVPYEKKGLFGLFK